MKNYFFLPLGIVIMCFHTFSLTAYHTYTRSNNISKSVRVTTGDHKFILRYDSYMLKMLSFSCSRNSD